LKTKDPKKKVLMRVVGASRNRPEGSPGGKEYQKTKKRENITKIDKKDLKSKNKKREEKTGGKGAKGTSRVISLTKRGNIKKKCHKRKRDVKYVNGAIIKLQGGVQ